MTLTPFLLHVGQNLRLTSAIKTLFDFGYERVGLVAERGDFSSRGGILDIYPWTHDNPLRIEFVGDKIDRIMSFHILTGKSISFFQNVTILPKGKVDILKIKRARFEVGEVSPISSFFDIRKGDYIVHINHGIGKYRGMEKIKTDGRARDHLAIEYADHARLYVPYEQRQLVQRYVGISGRPPKLYKLHTNEWQRTKERTARAIGDLAQELLGMQAKRSIMSGFKFSPDTDWQRELEASFQYDETPDQARSTQEIKKDMETARPMDRLVCGDVGYGKTEVALRAAFKAVMDNKQVALLCPTTILAQQHYNTFRGRLKDYPVNVQMLSRFKTPKEQNEILEGLVKGVVDIVIGTHRLLSMDVRFHNLGLVIIDEEQRFGVRHKEKLKRLRELVDVLTLTATPIPRTLYMSLMGVRDMSTINTPPKNRIPIETYVEFYDDRIVKRAISRELERGGQIYYVHNRVNGIERIAKRIAELLPRVKVAICHGQMHERDMERVMCAFIDREIDCLISTAIIESGLDIPNTNTLIVSRADTFGLADLYQLRGRVGRFEKKAYAYFLIPKNLVLTRDARRRLDAIEKFTELGSGFKIATEDLEIRGAGNLLGREQHGWIMAVGFDLYCAMLRESIGKFGTDTI